MPHRERFSLERLSKDAVLVLRACQALESEDNATLDNDLLSATARTLVESLDYTTLLKLSLITWHFDASSSSPSEGLVFFLRQRNDNAVLQKLHPRYQEIMRQSVPFDEFKNSFDFLL